MSKHYDYFVIGAGSGGVRSSRIAASHGVKVGVAESTHLGGTCVNIGCVPKKLMSYAADFHADFEDSEGYGWSYKAPKFHWKTFIENKNKEIDRLNGIYKNLLEKNNVEILNGHGRFVDANTVQVGDETITADKFLIATGAKPFVPDIPGAAHTIVSDDAFYLKDLPKHIVIVGGGYVAVEFAHIFSGMGSKVTLVYRGSMILRGFDDDMRLALSEEMQKQGITLHFHCDISEVQKKGKSLKVICDNGEHVDCDQVLMATGRVPNTDNLGLENAGVALEKNGSIQVNEAYQTSVPHIYALGDVSNKYHLTPVATAEGQALAHNLFGPDKGKKVDYRNIPTAIFSRPNISTVGLSEEQAAEEGYDFACFKTRFRPMKNTLSGRDEYTIMKIIVDKKTDEVIGVHMIGEDAAEIMQGFAVALNAGATKADFDRTIGIHPTSAEEFVTMR